MKNLKDYTQFVKENVVSQTIDEEIYENLITEEQLNEIFGMGDGLSKESKKFAAWCINALIYIKLGKKAKVPENFQEAKDVLFKYYEQKGEVEANGTKRPKFILKACNDKKLREKELLEAYNKFKVDIENREAIMNKQKSGLGGPAL